MHIFGTVSIDFGRRVKATNCLITVGCRSLKETNCLVGINCGDRLRAFAEFERSMIRQRVRAGLKRAVARGKRLGRPQIDSETERKAQRELRKGTGILSVAKMLRLGPAPFTDQT